MNAPKKIWVWDYAADQMVIDKPDSTDVLYVRGDIVEEMREALVTMIEAYRGEFGSHWGEQCEEETEEHDEVMKARATLKRLEEE